MSPARVLRGEVLPLTEQVRHECLGRRAKRLREFERGEHPTEEVARGIPLRLRGGPRGAAEKVVTARPRLDVVQEMVARGLSGAEGVGSGAHDWVGLAPHCGAGCGTSWRSRTATVGMGRHDHLKLRQAGERANQERGWVCGQLDIFGDRWAPWFRTVGVLNGPHQGTVRVPSGIVTIRHTRFQYRDTYDSIEIGSK